MSTELSKESEIIAGNALIMKFVGWVESDDPVYRQHEINIAEYHKNWNWIMAVVEKINALESMRNDVVYSNQFYVSIYGDAIVEIGLNNPRNGLKKGHLIWEWRKKGDALIDTLYRAIIAFITWYNSLNTQK